jgi:hypothetical protein
VRRASRAIVKYESVMNARTLFVIVGWDVLAACGSPVASSPAPSTNAPAATSPAASTPTASPCCASFDDIRAHDRQRVELVGVYEPTAVRRGTRSAEDDAKARTVALRLSGDVSVMLEVYYAPAGTRPAEEIARFANKRVRVVGTLRARTPDQDDGTGGGPMQTMIGPCVTEIESIEDAK